MNENPEGTPNPLNPNPAPVGPETAAPGAPATPAAPSAPAVDAVKPVSINVPSEPATPVMPTAPATAEPARPVAPAAPVVPTAAEPVTVNVVPNVPVANAPAENVPSAATAENVPAENAPANAAAENVATENAAGAKPEKKKSKGLLIALISIFCVLLVGGAIAALVVFDPFGWFKGGDDRVPNAISKLVGGDTPDNVHLNGTISLATAENGAVAVDFTTDLNAKKDVNSTRAAITATLPDESEIAFNVDEVKTENGLVYVRIRNLAEAISDYLAAYGPVGDVNCVTDDETGETNCETIPPETTSTDEVALLPVLNSLGLVTVLDNEWIRFGLNEASSVTEMLSIDSSAQCVIDAAAGLTNYELNVGSYYNNNPFIEYSTENLRITAQNDNLYRVTINADKFANFLNALPNNGFTNDLGACVDAIATSGNVSSDEVAEILAHVPSIYVEINDQNLFTRVYLKASNSDKTVDVIADIAISYPENITITEPSEYIDVNTVISNLFSSLYVENNIEVTEEVEE